MSEVKAAWEKMSSGGAAKFGTPSNSNTNSSGIASGSKTTPGEGGEKTSTEFPPQPPGILRDPNIAVPRKWNTDIPVILPYERVFPIQIGTELFRLSGASISSDGMCALSFFREWGRERWGGWREDFSLP
jgi:hypothetical protein